MVDIKINFIIEIFMVVFLIFTVIAAFLRPELHKIVATIFIILVLIHILLHYRHIIHHTKNFFKK